MTTFKSRSDDHHTTYHDSPREFTDEAMSILSRHSRTHEISDICFSEGRVTFNYRDRHNLLHQIELWQLDDPDYRACAVCDDEWHYDEMWSDNGDWYCTKDKQHSPSFQQYCGQPA